MEEKSIAKFFISSLLTLGNDVPQLKSHIHGSLNIRYLKDEFLDNCYTNLLYNGFYNALYGLQTMKEVFKQG